MARHFVLESIYAGIDEKHLYARLDFAAQLPEGRYHGMLHLAMRDGEQQVANLRLDAEVSEGKLVGWKLRREVQDKPIASDSQPRGASVALGRILELKLPMALLGAEQGFTLHLRFVLYRDRLPLDALPQEGWLEVSVAPEDVLSEIAYDAQ